MKDSIQWQKAQRGELYHAFVPEMIEARTRCTEACARFNNAGDVSRRRMVELWRDITGDKRPLPTPAATEEEDDALFSKDPWIYGPLRADYGTNVFVGEGAFVNFNAVFIDTCPITIGARTLVGPSCSFYSGTHPLDPALRNGTEGPEMGKPIDIGEDCWLGGNVIVLPGIKIGRGSTIGAGSVVTKDIPAFHVAAGNPARILRRIETALDPDCEITSIPASISVTEGAEKPMAQAQGNMSSMNY